MRQDHFEEHLANERTYLAWIRTSVAVMAFGFVVVKFSLFLTQLSVLLEHRIPEDRRQYTAVAGNIIVMAGVLTTLLGYLRYKRAEKQIQNPAVQRSNLGITLLTGFVLTVSLGLVVLLIVKM